MCIFSSACQCTGFGAYLQELAQQIKLYQARMNEISNKSHILAERSHDLGPLCARKLYHTGERETRVLDLVKTLNEPLEPYVSPLSSPGSPKRGIDCQYENPLKLFKNTEIGPIVTHEIDNTYNANSNEADIRKTKEPSFRTLSSMSPKKPSPIEIERIDPRVDLQTLTKLDVVKHSHADTNVETMEVTEAYPASSALQPKRAHSTERSVLEQPKFKIQKSIDGDLNASFEIGSVKSGSTDDPRSSVTRSVDRDRDDSFSLSSHPASASGDAASLANQMHSAVKFQDGQQPVSEDLTIPTMDSKTESQILPQEMLTLKQRKEAALSPYKPKSKYLASKLGRDNKDDDAEMDYFDTLANEFNESPEKGLKNEPLLQKEKSSLKKDVSRSSRGPLRADHQMGLKETKSEGEPAFMSASHDSRRSYKPRSPSPLTLPPMSRSQHDLINSKRSSSSERPSQRSLSMERIRGNRSVSPRTVAMTTRGSRSYLNPENQGPMSKSLTAGQMRTMGAPANKDKLNKETWDPVGACTKSCQVILYWTRARPLH